MTARPQSLGRPSQRLDDGPPPAVPLLRRLLFLAFVLLFAWSFYDAYLTYLNPVWSYFGFEYEPLNDQRAAVGVILLVGTALLQCPVLSSPAALITFLLYANVFVPGLITSLLLRPDALEVYGPFLFAISAVFAGAGLMLSRRPSSWSGASSKAAPSVALQRFTVWAWALSMLLLVAAYHSIMGFAPLDDQAMVYEQRVAGTADNPFLGYLQTYFSNIFNPTLLLLGLVQRRTWMVVAGLLGGVTMFAITAQRTILLLPIIMILMFLVLNGHRSRHVAAEVVMGVLALGMWFACHFEQESLVAALLALLLTFRTIAIPGLTLSQYDDVFSKLGHTYWTHVKGVDLLVPKPAYAPGDPLWPNLGYMIGDRTYNNPIFNVNANLFAGDGIAAAGALGVLCIGVVFTLWLQALNRASRGWPPLFATMALLPAAISLTNGNFFTTMLSFGGFFWLIVLHYGKPRQAFQPACA